jgi:hypothetical protein
LIQEQNNMWRGSKSKSITKNIDHYSPLCQEPDWWLFSVGKAKASEENSHQSGGVQGLLRDLCIMTHFCPIVTEYENDNPQKCERYGSYCIYSIFM